MGADLTDERTFVFTDVEASSARWHSDEVAMSRAMPLLTKLVTSAFAERHAVALGGEGDSAAAMFADAMAAFEAAAQIQLALVEQPWDVELKVRIGIHSGCVYRLSESEYGGTPLNYIGRLHKVGYGGQILVSDTTAATLSALLPPMWRLRDLGEYVLRDFPRRHIFQAEHAQLRCDFPPLNARRPVHGRQLPDNSFVGRTPELDSIAALLSRGITTITGPGGIGKTRLALEIVQRVRNRYRDGSCIVELAAITDETQVATAVANALHIDPQLEPIMADSISRSLASREMLVVLDNCEQVLAACGDVACLLASIEGVDVLATSRVPLGVSSEWVHPLQALPHPEPDAAAQQILRSEAVRLFVERARVVQPGFEVDARMAPQVAHICHQLSGIPLGIELAAAALRSIPLAQLDRELQVDGEIEPPSFGGGGVRAAIDWSLDSLTSAEFGLLSSLAVFPGGAPADLIDAVQPRELGSRRELLAALHGLVQRSLVQLEDSTAGGHYRLLEPLRLAALGRLDDGARHALESRHAAVIALLALASERRLQSKDEGPAVDDLDRLFPSLRATIHYYIDEDPDQAARVLLAIHEFAFLRMRFEMYSWTELLLGANGASRATESALRALSGIAAFNRGDLAAARQQCEWSLDIARTAGIEPAIYAHFGLISGYGLNCEFDRAQKHFMEALAWCKSSENDYFLANTLVLGSMAMTIQGDPSTGQKLAGSALDLAERVANPSAIAWALCALADAERLESPGGAHVHLEEALVLARRVRSRWVEGQALLNLATLCWPKAVDEGAVALVEALVNAEQTGSPIHARHGLRLSALLFGELGLLKEATLLLHAAGRDEIAVPPAPDVSRGLETVRAKAVECFGADVFAAYEGRGRRTPDHELLTLARQTLVEAVPG